MMGSLTDSKPIRQHRAPGNPVGSIPGQEPPDSRLTTGLPTKRHEAQSAFAILPGILRIPLLSILLFLVTAIVAGKRGYVEAKDSDTKVERLIKKFKNKGK